MLFVTVLTFVLLVCCWWVGDVAFRTKVILSLLYVGSFAFIWAKDYAIWSVPSQCVLAAIIGLATFGTDFLNRRVR